MMYLDMKWKEHVNSVMKLLKAADINYNPATYYYTPVTPYPRSIVPETKEVPSFDLSGFQAMFYIHIPFCSRRCTFCPFFMNIASKVSDRYMESVKNYINLFLGKNNVPSKFSLYFGGGSPNLLSLRQLKEIINSFDKENIEEITIELHPECCGSLDYFQKLADIGVNRVSIGMQSTDTGILKYSARGHGVLKLEKIIAKIKRIGLFVNVDIMFGGLFGETLQKAYKNFMYTFQKLKPDWITAYQVCIKDGTPEKLRYLKSAEKYPNTETILAMRALRQQVASENDYNYLFGDYFSDKQANPNYQKKRWNEKSAIIGVGPGTHSYVIDEKRKTGFNWYSPFDMETFISMLKRNENAIDRMIVLDSNDIDSWRIISKLKTTGKVSGNIPKNIVNLLEKLSSLGLLNKNKEGFFLSETGILIEDMIYAILMNQKIWEHFSSRKKEIDYSQQDAKYDWFFEPETVLKFKKYLES